MKLLRPASRAFLLLGLTTMALAFPAQAQTFTVANVLGDAQVGPSASSLQPAVVASSHNLPSWGRTGDNSSLTIAFNDQNKFRLLPDSMAEVKTGEGDSASDWHRVVSLKIGEAKLTHDSSGSPTVDLKCETPTAVCGAVGTEFDVIATTGTYSVLSGQISVQSSSEEGLSLPSVRGGSVVFAPGKQNTYSHGSFTGTVELNGERLHASDATFTVAKILGGSGETAVRISSGSLGSYGPGSYISDGGSLKPVESGSPAAEIHPKYLAAAQREGALSTRSASYHAVGRSTGEIDSELADAAAEATKLREELFNRETVREVNRQIESSIIDNTLRNGAGGGGYGR